MLGRLLRDLKCQRTNGLFEYSIVVADNDSDRSAAAVVAQESKDSPIKINYCAEPRQNIALARNTAIANATGNYIAFIDDDEFPSDDWLLLLLQACTTYGAHGVLGPVRPHFEQAPPRWIKAGSFFERPEHKTGFVIDWTEGRTGNLLFRRNILNGISEAFRPEFGSGGEDRDFFRRLIGRGMVFVWCNEAVAHETVPPIRWKRGFMLRRALLRGKMALNHRRSAGDLAKSVIAVAGYTTVLPLFLLAGQHVFMKYAIKVFDHLGKLLALVGLNPVKETYVTE
jgi:glycosyltransferase involved in cell wall biosynthesis